MKIVTVLKRTPLTVGQTETCRIHGVPTRVTWRDGGRLLVGPDDNSWPIDGLIVDDDRVHFICKDGANPNDNIPDPNDNIPEL